MKNIQRQSFSEKNKILKSSYMLNRYSYWQYLVIVISILLLTLSALPNVYREQVVIDVSNKVELESVIQVNELHQLLSSKGYNVKSINSQLALNGETQTRKVILNSNENITSAQEYLKSELGEKYIVSTSTQDTIPNWLKSMGGEPIQLGLDLSGGVLFVLKVDSQQAFSERLEHIKQMTLSLLREQKIRGVNVSIKDQKKIELSYSDSLKIDPNKLTKISEEMVTVFPELFIDKTTNNLWLMSYPEKANLKFHQEIMHQSLTTLRGRIEQLGITEAITLRQGKDKIRIELPGVKSPEDAKRIIGATASLDFYQLQQHGGKNIISKTGEIISIDPIAIFSGKHIKGAQAGRDEMGSPLVHLTLDNIGGDKMLRFSKNNIGQPMVTVFSEYYQNNKGEADKKSKVISVATIQAVLGSRFSITNLASNHEAQELALLLRAGSLTAPITIIKERTIGPSLGAANIHNGMAALMLGVGLTLAFMALWYRRLGLIANTALILNLVCLLGLMSLLPGVVLTLPGIAGLVLTVGMAVDTNVIIFERIKEERERGLSISIAVDRGYKNAFATVLDANVTTLLTAIILYAIGYGPVKGFAVTLGLGILTSMFTGVFVSRALTNLFYVNQKVNKTHDRSNLKPDQVGAIS